MSVKQPTALVMTLIRVQFITRAVKKDVMNEEVVLHKRILKIRRMHKIDSDWSTCEDG